jgi:hypothetical protein
MLLIVASILAACGAAPAAQTTPIVEAPTTAPTDIAEPTAPVVEETPEAAEPTVEATPEAAEPTSAPAADDTTTDLSDAELIAALQETVDLWAQAFTEADPEMLAEAIDRRSPSLLRTQQARLKTVSESIGAGSRQWGGTVVDVTRREHGYVQAHIDSGNIRRGFTFKEVDGKWLLAEPKRAELGKRETIETEHFTIQYFPWDEAMIDTIATMMEDVHTTITDKMGRGPEQKSLVQLIPTFEASPGLASGNALAFYRRGFGARRGVQEMVINTPDSFGFGAYDANAGWEPSLEATLAHEYVHLVNDCCFTPIARMHDWMIEGLAEHISDGPISREGEVALAVQNDAIIPIQDTSGSRYDKQDLEHLTLLDQDISLAYGLSSSLVNYIVENYGGLDGWWTLIEDFDKTQDLNQSLQNVLNISLEEFEQNWIDDLKQRYG